MTRIADLNPQSGQTVCGTYRVLQVKRRLWHTPDKPSIQLTLADASGTALCVISTSDMFLSHRDDNVVVQVRGKVAATADGAVGIRATHCTPVPSSHCVSWHLLPRCWVPDNAHPAFDRLRALLDRLADGPLRTFMHRLFADRTIAEPFLCVSGSRTHHHAYAGGLLIHSVECAEAAERLGPFFLPEHEAPLAIVGALLHDIAKIRTLIAPGRAQQPIHGVTHEALNLEVLAPFLAELDAAWPTGGTALRAMLAPAPVYGASSRRAPLLVTDFVRYIDHLSAGADLRQDRFRHLSHRQRCTRTEHGQLLARVLPPEPASHTIRHEVRA